MSSPALTKRIAMLTATVMAAAILTPVPSVAKSDVELASATRPAPERPWGDREHAVLWQRQCTEGYPMHRIDQCSTATGGPSGSLY